MNEIVSFSQQLIEQFMLVGEKRLLMIAFDVWRELLRASVRVWAENCSGQVCEMS